MNENHLGGMMAMASPVAVGLAMDSKAIEKRIGWAAGGAVCALACILSFSRGAMLALAIGMAVFIVVYAVRLSQSHRSIFRSRTLPILAIGALAVIRFRPAGRRPGTRAGPPAQHRTEVRGRGGCPAGHRESSNRRRRPRRVLGGLRR
jgi:hypothetical protein